MIEKQSCWLCLRVILTLLEQHPESNKTLAARQKFLEKQRCWLRLRLILSLRETTSREQQKAFRQAENFRKIELLIVSENDSKCTGDTFYKLRADQLGPQLRARLKIIFHSSYGRTLPIYKVQILTKICKFQLATFSPQRHEINEHTLPFLSCMHKVSQRLIERKVHAY